MKLYLDSMLLNKGPRPGARAPKAAAPAASGSKVADVGTGEKPGAVAATAPTANAAKKPKAPKAQAATPAAPAPNTEGAVKAPKQSKSGASAGAGTQMVTCPLPPDVCYAEGGSGSGKHRANSPKYLEHVQIAANRGVGSTPNAQQQPKKSKAQKTVAATQEQGQQKQPGAAKGAPPGQQAQSGGPEKPTKPKTPSVQIGDKEVHGAAAASVADVPEAPPSKPPKEIPVDKPSKSKAPTGKQKRAKVAPDPAALQMQSQHLQEYLSGSREEDHHKVIHAMTVAEHRRAAAEFRSAGAGELAKLHEQAAVSKPRLKDLSGTQAVETVPEGERPYSSHYLDGYISHASRYLAGGPGGHPSSRYGQVHSMTESQHNELAQRLESAGANSAAARHRRIAAMKKDFSSREKSMLDHKEAQSKARAELRSKASVASAAKREAKRRESLKVPNNMFEGSGESTAEAPKNHADDLRQVGSNALSHLIHNHDMPPEHKRDLLQQVLKLQDLHDRAESPAESDKADLAQLKNDLGHYGQESYTGRKSLPGRRYLSRFDAHELDAHADLAEMSGMGDLASKYRDAAAAKHESTNRDRIKAQGKADKAKASASAKEAKEKERTQKQQTKAAQKADKDKQRAEAKAQKDAATAERKRLASAPHLPGDHGEYVQHAQSHSDRLNDFLNSAADLEPHERSTLEQAHKVMSAHTKLSSPATPEQRRELADALKVSQAHMDRAKFHQLGQGPESAPDKKYKVNTHALYQTFASGWHQGSAVAQTAAKDQNAGNLAQQLPQTVGATVMDSTHNLLSEDRSKRPQEDTDTGDATKYRDIASDGSKQSTSTTADSEGNKPTTNQESQSDSYESFNEPEYEESYESFNEPSDNSAASASSSPVTQSTTQALAQKKRPSARAKPQPKPAPVQSAPPTPTKKRPSARAVKKSDDMFGLYLDLNKAVQIPNVGMDSDAEKVRQKNSGNSGGGSGFTPDKPSVGRDWHEDDEQEETSKSFLSEMQDLLRSMSENLSSQLRADSNSHTETEFLMTQGYSISEAKYNTNLLSKGFLRKKYDSWLLSRMEKSLSSLWSKQ